MCVTQLDIYGLVWFATSEWSLKCPSSPESHANQTETMQALVAGLKSAAFADYKERVGPTFANPPHTSDITAIASTRDQAEPAI